MKDFFTQNFKYIAMLSVAVWFGIVLSRFMNRPIPQRGDTIVTVFDTTIVFNDNHYDVPIGRPSKETIIERYLPVESIPDSLLRAELERRTKILDTLNVIREYDHAVNDSFLSGSSWIKVRGQLLGYSLTYKPHDIHISDTSFHRVRQTLFSMYAGAGLASDWQPSVNMMVTRGKWAVKATSEPLAGRFMVEADYKLFDVKERK